MNYLLDKFHAKSSVDPVDMSVYMYMNQRTLRRVPSQLKTLSDLTEDDIVDLEDEALYIIEALVSGPTAVPLYIHVIYNWINFLNRYPQIRGHAGCTENDTPKRAKTREPPQFQNPQIPSDTLKLNPKSKSLLKTIIQKL